MVVDQGAQLQGSSSLAQQGCRGGGLSSTLDVLLIGTNGKGTTGHGSCGLYLGNPRALA